MSDNVFQVWIVRLDTAERPFSMRFNATNGRGMFMLPQSGVTAARPASMEDEITSLSAKEVRTVRYIHISTNPTHKATWTIEVNQIEALLQIPVGRWIKLVHGPQKDLVLPELVPSIDLVAGGSRKSTSWEPPAKTSSQRQAPRHDGPPSMPQSDNNKEQTAAERILVLEDKLSQSNHRVAQLKRRVAGLERDVERLGGTVQPWVLDPLKSNARNTES